jgi:hypothetical protein
MYRGSETIYQGSGGSTQQVKCPKVAPRRLAMKFQVPEKETQAHLTSNTFETDRVKSILAPLFEFVLLVTFALSRAPLTKTMPVFLLVPFGY